jgi:hypothetical protein
MMLKYNIVIQVKEMSLFDECYWSGSKSAIDSHKYWVVGTSQEDAMDSTQISC